MATLQQEARALGDPTRHTIFRYLAASKHPVDVAELTELFGLNHNAIRQHLAKLLAVGLIAESTAPPGRPGRPRLLYQLGPGVESRWGVTGPYERLSLLLAEVVHSGDSPVEVGRRAGRALAEQAAARGDGAGDAVERLVEVMAEQGFDPSVRRRGQRVELVLDACPFASTAAAAPEVVCAIHRGIAEGVLEGTGADVVDLLPKDPFRAGCRLPVATPVDPPR